MLFKHNPTNYMKAHQTLRTYLAGASVSLCAALAFAHHAKAGDYDAHYAAKLSKKDHYNSNRERLTSVADILRQDRANYHNGDGDTLDEDDQGYFSTSKARNKFGNHKIILKGISAAEIANRTPVVIVEVHGDTIYVFSE
jgi:hypothetical protein